MNCIDAAQIYSTNDNSDGIGRSTSGQISLSFGTKCAVRHIIWVAKLSKPTTTHAVGMELPHLCLSIWVKRLPLYEMRFHCGVLGATHIVSLRDRRLISGTI